MKPFNRGVDIHVSKEDALKVNNKTIIDKDGKIYGDIHAAAGSIGTAELADDGVTTAKIAAGAITVTELASNAVETAKIKDDAVTADKLATDAVETTKIKDANVTLAKLAAVLQPSHVIKFIVEGSTIEGTTLGGLLVGDIVMTNTGNGPSTFATCIAEDTLPADPENGSYLIVFRAVA